MASQTRMHSKRPLVVVVMSAAELQRLLHQPSWLEEGGSSEECLWLTVDASVNVVVVLRTILGHLLQMQMQMQEFDPERRLYAMIGQRLAPKQRPYNTSPMQTATQKKRTGSPALISLCRLRGWCRGGSVLFLSHSVVHVKLRHGSR